MNVGTAVGIWGSKGLAARGAVRDAVLDGGDSVITSQAVDRPYTSICQQEPAALAIALGHKPKLPQAVPDAASVEFHRNAPRLEDGGGRLGDLAHVNSVGFGAVAAVQQRLDDHAGRVGPSGAAQFLVATCQQRSNASLEIRLVHDAAP